MTPAQWVYEFSILSAKEQDERDYQMKFWKVMLVRTLGLDAFNKQRGLKDEEFIPLSLLAGNHHLINSMLKKAEEDGVVDAANTVEVPDAEYSEMEARMAAGMEPIDFDPFEGMTPEELLAKHTGKLLGVQVVDDTKVTAEVKE